MLLEEVLCLKGIMTYSMQSLSGKKEITIKKNSLSDAKLAAQESSCCFRKKTEMHTILQSSTDWKLPHCKAVL